MWQFHMASSSSQPDKNVNSTLAAAGDQWHVTIGSPTGQIVLWPKILRCPDSWANSFPSLLIPSRMWFLLSSCRFQCIYFTWWEQRAIEENAFFSSSEFLFMGNLTNLVSAWFGSKPNIEISLCRFYYTK